MTINIEIKARINFTTELLAKVTELSDEKPVEIAQDDTFFRCPNGRLKLRAFDDGTGKLIFYRRSNQPGPKESFYVISTTTEPDTLREVLSTAYGRIGRVEKRRTVYSIGRVQLHLDRVKGLGDFLEIEVVLGDGDSSESGQNDAYRFMEHLGIKSDQLVDGAYLDLLEGETDFSA